MQLINQYRILALLDEDNKDRYEWSAEVIERGYSELYSFLMLSLDEAPLSSFQQDEIREILEMYERIDWRIKNAELDLSQEERSQLAFMGFSHNTESAELGFAQAFCSERRPSAHHTHSSLKKDGSIPRSPAPQLEIYRRMLAVYREFEEDSPLTLGQLRLLLEAKTR